MKKYGTVIMAFFTGVSNVIFGSGGGILAVECLKMYGLKQKYAQATALCAMLIMSFFTCGYYWYNGYFDFKTALLYVPFGIPGALIGSYLLTKIKDMYLNKIFAVFIIFAGLRVVFK